MRYFFFSKKLLKLVAIYDIKSRYFYGTTKLKTNFLQNSYVTYKR